MGRISQTEKHKGGLEVEIGEKKRLHADPDNPDNEEMVRVCPAKGKHILNPIIDWTDGEVWEFIKEFNIPYCELYDEGYTRIGCIGCPMSSRQAEELEELPKYKNAYLKSFERMLKNLDDANLITTWKTPEDVMKWFLNQRY